MLHASSTGYFCLNMFKQRFTADRGLFLWISLINICSLLGVLPCAVFPRPLCTRARSGTLVWDSQLIVLVHVGPAAGCAGAGSSLGCPGPRHTD